MSEVKVFTNSKVKDHVSFKKPKNYKTTDLESYCANKLGDVIWCYFSSELGIFLKNLTTRATERFLTIEGVDLIDIDYNTSNSSYALLYRKEGLYSLRYVKDYEYKTKSLDLNCDKAFVHYSSLYNKIMIIFKDLSTHKLVEYNSEDDFEFPLELTTGRYQKQELLQVGLSEELGFLAFDFVVSDNTLLEDLPLYPKFQDLEYREYPINLSEFKHVINKGS